MILAFSYLFLGGIPSGLAAYLQADAKGWRYLGSFGALFLISFGLILYLANGQLPSPDLAHNRGFAAASLIAGMMFLALIGAVIGKIFTERENPVALGLKTTVGVAVVQFCVATFGGWT